MTTRTEQARRIRAEMDACLDELGSLNRIQAAERELERLTNGWTARSTVAEALAASGQTWADIGLRDEDAAVAEETVAQILEVMAAQVAAG